MAEGFLSWSFGVAPTITELEASSGVLKRIYQHVKDLHTGAGKVHTTQSHVVTGTSMCTELPISCPYGECNLPHRYFKTDETKFTLGVTAKYRYHFPEYMFGFMSRLMPVLSSLNLVPNVSTTWEMFPFSFVLDWIVNTQKVFDYCSALKDPHDVQVDIIDLCVTEKIVTSTLIEAEFPCFGSRHKILESSVTQFERTTGTNALYARIPWVKWPTNMQITLGAALAWAVGIFPRFK